LIVGSTFVGNSATRNGGAIATGQHYSTNVNCTFFGNTAGNDGGAIWVSKNPSWEHRMYNCTVYGNSASNGGGIARSYGYVYLASTIVASNTATSLGPDIRSAAGYVVDSGCNLVGNASGWTGADTSGPPNANGSYVGTSAEPIDPELKPLADNGGLTDTCALRWGSLAVDHGSNPLNLVTDQRGAGYARRVGPAADIGAFELGAAPRGTILLAK
jgi:predicted outer membrane repeat protein